MINSRNNLEIIEVSKLKQKKHRDLTGNYLIEGIKLVKEALNNNADILKIYLIPSILKKIEIPASIKIVEVNEKVLNKISSQKNPEGIVAVVKKNDVLPNRSSKILVLDNIQNPGNLGTIIRTADAAGFDSVYCSSNCVDLYNDKTIRATMGSLFHIPVLINQDLSIVLKDLKNKSFEVIATVLDGEDLYLNRVIVPEKLALLFGNESHGIRNDLLDYCTKKIKLPIFGKAESLNVSVAAGIFMYAYSDQK